MDPKYFGPKIFLDPKFFSNQNFFRSRNFLDPRCTWEWSLTLALAQLVVHNFSIFVDASPRVFVCHYYSALIRKGKDDICMRWQNTEYWLLSFLHLMSTTCFLSWCNDNVHTTLEETTLLVKVVSKVVVNGSKSDILNVKAGWSGVSKLVCKWDLCHWNSTHFKQRPWTNF